MGGGVAGRLIICFGARISGFEGQSRVVTKALTLNCLGVMEFGIL